MKSSTKTILLLTCFSIAMGFMETAVVVYLRKIYYPEGFHLPLKIIDPSIAIVELLREAATIIMLVAIAILAGKSRIQRFSYFLICFGVWDIIYYIFLKVFLDWPSTLLEGDVLFLIPIPWIGPVLAPCILSLTMLFVARVLLNKEATTGISGIGWKNVSLMISGSCIVILSFVINVKEYIQLNANDTYTAIIGTQHYNWWLFAGGEIFILIPVLLLLKTHEKG